MSVSNRRRLLELQRRKADLVQRHAWAGTGKRALLAQELARVERKIAEMGVMA